MDTLFEDDSIMDVIQVAGSDQLVETTPLDVFNLEDSDSHFPVEVCVVDGEQLVLPSKVCENVDIFMEMLSVESLVEVLTPEDVEHLQSYLPHFGEDDEEQKVLTWDMLFSGQNFKYGNPVINFCHKVEAGWYNPEIVQTRKLFNKMHEANVGREQKNYYLKLLQSVIVSRQQLVEAASQLPPGQPVKMSMSGNSRKSVIAKSSCLTLEERVRKRYFDELRICEAESSDDENFPEGAPSSLSKKQRRHLCTVQASLNCEFKPIQSTLTLNIYNQLVVVDAKNEKVEDELSRAKTELNSEPAASNPAESGRKTVEVKRLGEPVIDVLSKVTGSKNVYEISEDTYKVILNKHRCLRREGKVSPELDVTGIRLEGIAERVRICALNKRPPALKSTDLFPKKIKKVVSDSSSSDEMESEVESVKKTKAKRAPTSNGQAAKPVKTKVAKSVSRSVEAVVSDLSADVKSIEMACVIKQEPDEPLPPASLTQDTHSSFFSLMREMMFNTDGPLTLNQYVEAMTQWNNSPISPLNEWYSQLMSVHQRANSWSSLLQSALEFLIANRLVAVDTLKMALASPCYTWAGQGRDTDALLHDLSNIWLQQQESMAEEKVDVEATNEFSDSMLNSSQETAALSLGTTLDLGGEEAPDLTSSLFDVGDVIHPPRSVTSWVVRPSTAEERASYQDHERRRYCQPHKAFTFRQHGYESIVGPVKGVYSPAQGVGQQGTKVRGHNLMVPERPACVTLLSLVRDAAARLPNGEGTRADICELMKDSQYLSLGAEASLHSVVSGALDRLHYEADPCVKYDSGRKVWIYLHRHRSEAEFEQLHKQHQGMPSRVKKPRSEQRRSASGTPGSAAGKAAKSNAASAAASAAAAVATTGAAPAPAATATVTTNSAASLSSSYLSSTQQTSVGPAAAAAAPAVLEAAVPATIANTPVSVTKTVAKLGSPAAAAIRHEISRVSAAAVPISSATVANSTSAGSSNNNSNAAMIQTFQITTSSGIQTIRVAAPSNLPTALLARTLQISAQQQGALQGQKITVAASPVNGASTIKQVILSPPVGAAKSPGSAMQSRPNLPTATTVLGSATSSPSSSASIIRLNVPVTTSVAAAAAAAAAAGQAKTRLPASPVRLAGRQNVTTATASSLAAPVQTFLIRPPVPSTSVQTLAGSTAAATVVSAGSNTSVPGGAPRLVMVNNKLINLSGATAVAAGNNRMIRPNVTMAAVRKPTAAGGTLTTAAARPVLARMVSAAAGAGGQQSQQQQVITLENLLSLASPQQKGAGKTGVVQLPLSAIAGLNVGGGAATSTANQPTTVLLQNVKGGQSILLPAGFQGGTINIRGVRLANVSQGQPKQALVARLVTPQQQPPQTVVAPTTPTPKSADL